jgi:hypothetical protein
MPVQRELQLAPEQFDEIMQLRSTLPQPAPPGWAPQSQAVKPSSAKMIQQANDAEAALDSILTESQASRLRQISLQMDGARAFDDPDVISALKLTSQQSEAIRRIRASFAPGPMGRPGPGEPPPQDGPGGRERDDQIVKQILAELSPSQIQVWNRLLGPRFNGPSPMFHGPFDQPPPR